MSPSHDWHLRLALTGISTWPFHQSTFRWLLWVAWAFSPPGGIGVVKLSTSKLRDSKASVIGDKVCVLASWGCRDEMPRTGWLKTYISFLTVWEARGMKSGCRQSCSPYESPRKESFLSSSAGRRQPLAFLDFWPHRSNLCLSCHMVFFPLCASVVVCPLVFV